MEVKSIQWLIFRLVAEVGRLRSTASAVSTGQEIAESFSKARCTKNVRQLYKKCIPA